MRTLVALAVMGLCSALPHQAYNSLSSSSYGTPHAEHYQPEYTGPLASSVPAGVNGKVTPVADTYEVTAARNDFFNAYQKQLAAVGATGHYSAAAPAYHNGAALSTHHHVVAAPAYHQAVAVTHHVAPAYHNAAAISTHHHVVAAPAYRQAVAVTHHVAPVTAPAYQAATIHSPAAPSYNAVSHRQVTDTPDVAAAKSQFFDLYNKQAAAAAAAPDDPISYDNHHYGHHY